MPPKKSTLDRILYRLARPEDRPALEQPGGAIRMRIVARIALRHTKVYAALLVISAVAALAGGMDVHHRTEMPEFCAACHEMGDNFGSWRVSMHGNVKCIECHARPGLSGWVAAKLAGMKQLVTHFQAESINDIHLETEHQDIVSENCQRCHESAERLAEIDGLVISHEGHLDIGVKCTTCHSGTFAHPDPERVDAEVPHVDVSECWACHDGTKQVGGKVAFDALDEANCVRCHPDAELAIDHGAGDPSVADRAPCVDCHEPTEFPLHFPTPPEKDEQMCRRCHELPDRAKLGSMHPDFEKGNCRQCHSVMSPSHLYRVGPKRENAICFSCHEDIEAIVTAEEGPQGEKMSAFNDGEDDLHHQHTESVSEDGPAWCLSCHRAHGAEGPHLLHLRDDDGDTGSYRAIKGGGECSGSCHGEGETSTYERAVFDKPAGEADPE